jgi:hypothetical protein
MTDPVYPKHHPWDLEPHYTRHVGAMTSEALHSKADIAIQLAWRDQEIERLRRGLRRLESLPERFSLSVFHNAGLCLQDASTALLVARRILEDAENEPLPKEAP